MINEILNKYVFEISKQKISKKEVLENIKIMLIFFSTMFLLSTIALYFIFKDINIASLKESSDLKFGAMLAIMLVTIMASLFSTGGIIVTTIEKLFLSKEILKNLENNYIQFEYNSFSFSFPGFISFINNDIYFSKKLEKKEIDFFINQFRNKGYSDEEIKEKISERLKNTDRFNPGLDVTLNDMAFIGLKLHEGQENEDKNIKNIVDNMLNDQ
jgi:hypothetical protein